VVALQPHYSYRKISQYVLNKELVEPHREEPTAVKSCCHIHSVPVVNTIVNEIGENVTDCYTTKQCG